MDERDKEIEILLDKISHLESEIYDLEYDNDRLRDEIEDLQSDLSQYEGNSRVSGNSDVYIRNVFGKEILLNTYNYNGYPVVDPDDLRDAMIFYDRQRR